MFTSIAEGICKTSVLLVLYDIVTLYILVIMLLFKIACLEGYLQTQRYRQLVSDVGNTQQV